MNLQLQHKGLLAKPAPSGPGELVDAVKLIRLIIPRLDCQPQQNNWSHSGSYTIHIFLSVLTKSPFCKSYLKYFFKFPGGAHNVCQLQTGSDTMSIPQPTSLAHCLLSPFLTLTLPLLSQALPDGHFRPTDLTSNSPGHLLKLENLTSKDKLQTKQNQFVHLAYTSVLIHLFSWVPTSP